MDSTRRLWFAATLAEGRSVYLPVARPPPCQPGTLPEQLAVVDCYLADPTCKSDPDGAWELARRLNIPHARRRRE